MRQLSILSVTKTATSTVTTESLKSFGKDLHFLVGKIASIRG